MRAGWSPSQLALARRCMKSTTELLVYEIHESSSLSLQHSNARSGMMCSISRKSLFLGKLLRHMYIYLYMHMYKQSYVSLSFYICLYAYVISVGLSIPSPVFRIFRDLPSQIYSKAIPACLLTYTLHNQNHSFVKGLPSFSIYLPTYLPLKLSIALYIYIHTSIYIYIFTYIHIHV